MSAANSMSSFQATMELAELEMADRLDRAHEKFECVLGERCEARAHAAKEFYDELLAPLGASYDDVFPSLLGLARDHLRAEGVIGRSLLVCLRLLETDEERDAFIRNSVVEIANLAVLATALGVRFTIESTPPPEHTP